MKIRFAFAIVALLACRQPSFQQSTRAPEPKHAAPDQTITAGIVPPNVPTQPLSVGGEVTIPRVLHRVEPNVEPCAKREIRGSGNISIEAVIDEHGTVINPHVIRPVHPCIDQAALEAIKEWRFQPGTLRGKAVPVKFNFVVLIHWR